MTQLREFFRDVSNASAFRSGTVIRFRNFRIRTLAAVSDDQEVDLPLDR